jgi:hypothetical protein
MTQAVELICLWADQYKAGLLTQDEVLGQDGLVKQLTGRLLQRVLEAEMDGHPGYQKHDNSEDNSGDSRNGYSEKTVVAIQTREAFRVPRANMRLFRNLYFKIPGLDLSDWTALGFKAKSSRKMRIPPPEGPPR